MMRRREDQLEDTKNALRQTIGLLGWKLADLKVFYGYPGIDCRFTRRKFKDTGTQGTRLQVVLGRFWLDTVYKEGIAIVENHLVLDASSILSPKVACEKAWDLVLARADCHTNSHPKRIKTVVRPACMIGGHIRTGSTLDMAYELVIQEYHTALTGQNDPPF